MTFDISEIDTKVSDSDLTSYEFSIWIFDPDAEVTLVDGDNVKLRYHSASGRWRFHDGSHNGNCRRKDTRYSLRNELTQSVCIVCVIANYIAVVVGIEILDGKSLHIIEHSLSHIVKKALCHNRHKTGLKICKRDTDCEQTQHYEN